VSADWGGSKNKNGPCFELVGFEKLEVRHRVCVLDFVREMAQRDLMKELRERISQNF
jgi:hypothetical protein